jgi:Signal recognition particle GTPase
MNILKILKNLLNKNDFSIEEVEEFLISKNFGVKFTEDFISRLKEEHTDYLTLFEKLIYEAFSNVDPKVNIGTSKPTVFMFVGSNGSGKTTALQKLQTITE